MMGAAKNMWFTKYEEIGDEYALCEISRDTAERRLAALGFNPSEVADHLDSQEQARMYNEGAIQREQRRRGN